MPISLAKVRERTKELDVDLGDGDTVHIVYRPGVYTVDFESELKAGQAEGDRSVITLAICKVIADWDVYEDDAQKRKLALEPDAVKALPMVVMVPMFEAINEDMRPKRKTGGSFSDGSEG